MDFATFEPPTTPALVIDRAALMHNLAVMQRCCDEAGVQLRAHGKMHKCSTIGRLQIELGAVGLCCQTVGEAEAFVAAGIGDVLVSAPIPPWGAPRLAALARDASVAVVADDEAQIARLDEAVREAGTLLRVLVDIDLGMHRAGCLPVDALMLAQAIDAAAHLRFGGEQGYLGHLQHVPDLAARRAANAAATATLKSIVDALAAAGLPPPVVTGGGTGTFAYDLPGGVFTELQAGSYALMDAEYGGCGAPDGGDWLFRPALFIAASVVSASHKTHATCNAGLKAVSVDGPAPLVVAGAPEGSRWFSYGDEHGAIVRPEHVALFASADRYAEVDRIDADEAVPWPDDACAKTGALVWLQPGHCDPTINLYDAFLVAADGGTEVWPIDARRRSAP